MSARGAQRERAVRDRLTADGWLVVRASGSLGCADLVALRGGSRPLLIEVKSTAGGPFERFGPAERERLSLAARQAGADAWLAHWPPRGALRWVPEPAWPNGRTGAAEAASGPESGARRAA